MAARPTITIVVNRPNVVIEVLTREYFGVARLRLMKKYGLRMSDRLVLPGIPIISDLETVENVYRLSGQDNRAVLELQLVSGPPTDPGWFMMHLEEPTSEDPFYLCLSGADKLADVNRLLGKLFDPKGEMVRPPILMKAKVPKDATEDQIDFLRKNFAAEPKKRMDCDCGCVQREVHWVDFDYEVSGGAGPA